MKTFTCPSSGLYSVQFTTREVQLLNEFIQTQVDNTKTGDRRRVPGWNATISSLHENLKYQHRINRSRADEDSGTDRAVPRASDFRRIVTRTAAQRVGRRTTAPAPRFEPFGEDERDR